MTDIYTSLDQRPYQSHHRLFETTLNHPVEAVWPHVLYIDSWMTDHRLETIAGEPGKVGHFARVWPHDLAEDVPEPHYHLYGIAEIIPFKLIVLEVFREKGGSYGDPAPRLTFDNILITGIADVTKVILLLTNLLLEPRQEASAEAVTSSDDVLRKRLEGYFENLKALVESS